MHLLRNYFRQSLHLNATILHLLRRCPVVSAQRRAPRFPESVRLLEPAVMVLSFFFIMLTRHTVIPYLDRFVHYGVGDFLGSGYPFSNNAGLSFLSELVSEQRFCFSLCCAYAVPTLAGKLFVHSLSFFTY